MSTETKIQLSELNKLTPLQMVDNDAIQGKFVKLYDSIHGGNNGELILAREKYHFVRQINDNPGLKECTSLSLYGCFMDVAVSGLSFEGGSQPLIYMIPRSFNVGTKQAPVWEKRSMLQVSPYGELTLRMRAGQIKHADNPVIVYEGDSFQHGSDRDGNWVKHVALTPRKSEKIIAAYIRIVRLDGSVDFSWLEEEDINRLKGYSAKQNKGNANELYSSNNGQVDVGFLKAKVIKHAFKTYPKLNTQGQFTELATEALPDEKTNIDYGVQVPDNATTSESFCEVEEVKEVETIRFDDAADPERSF